MFLGAQPPQRLPAPPPLSRSPSPSASWSRYPSPAEMPRMVPLRPMHQPMPQPRLPLEPPTSVPMRRVISRPLSPLIEAEPIDEPETPCQRAFVWTLRAFFGAAALAIPGGLIWFGLRPRT